MTTIITGTTLTSGYQLTADSTGTLTIQTGSTPTTAMIINANGLVGVGNTPFQYNASTGVGAELSIQSSSTTNAALTIQAGLSRYFIGTPFDANVLEIGGNGGAWPGNTTNANGAKITISPTGVQTIKFAPTQVASSDVNTLDDYEEGTWTPNINSNNGTGTFVTKVGSYVKIGKQVTIWFVVDGGNSLAAGTTQYLTGLPFNIGSLQTNTIMGHMGSNGPATRTQQLMTLSGNRAVMYIYIGGSQETTTISFGAGCATYWID